MSLQFLLSRTCSTEFRACRPSPSVKSKVPGRGTFQVQTLPLTDQGYQSSFATDVTDQTHLRSQAGRLEKMAAVGRVVTGVVNELEHRSPTLPAMRF